MDIIDNQLLVEHMYVVLVGCAAVYTFAFSMGKMVYTICRGKTPMKKNKPTMPYMQLFKLHLICVFLRIYLANVKNWPKNGYFRAKNHVLRNFRKNTSQK